MQQIEQFIESIFPTQDIKKLEAEKNATRTPTPSMETSEAVFLILAVLGVLLLIGGLMVCSHLFISRGSNALTICKIGTAWMMGARFDKVFEGLKPGTILSETAASIASSVPSGVPHEEL